MRGGKRLERKKNKEKKEEGRVPEERKEGAKKNVRR